MLADCRKESKQGVVVVVESCRKFQKRLHASLFLLRAHVPTHITCILRRTVAFFAVCVCVFEQALTPPFEVFTESKLTFTFSSVLLSDASSKKHKGSILNILFKLIGQYMWNRGTTLHIRAHFHLVREARVCICVVSCVVRATVRTLHWRSVGGDAAKTCGRNNVCSVCTCNFGIYRSTWEVFFSRNMVLFRACYEHFCACCLSHSHRCTLRLHSRRFLLFLHVSVWSVFTRVCHVSTLCSCMYLPFLCCWKLERRAL